MLIPFDHNNSFSRDNSLLSSINYLLPGSENYVNIRKKSVAIYRKMAGTANAGETSHR